MYGRSSEGPRLPAVVTPLVDHSCEMKVAADSIKVKKLHSWTQSSLKRLRYLYNSPLFFPYLDLSSSFQVHQRYPTPNHPPIPNLLSCQLDTATASTRQSWRRHIIGMQDSRRPLAVVPLCPKRFSGSTTCHKTFKPSCLKKEHGGYCPNCGDCVPWKEGCSKHKKRKKDLLPKPPTKTETK